MKEAYPNKMADIQGGIPWGIAGHWKRCRLLTFSLSK